MRSTLVVTRKDFECRKETSRGRDRHTRTWKPKDVGDFVRRTTTQRSVQGGPPFEFLFSNRCKDGGEVRKDTETEKGAVSLPEPYETRQRTGTKDY